MEEKPVPVRPPVDPTAPAKHPLDPTAPDERMLDPTIPIHEVPPEGQPSAPAPDKTRLQAADPMHDATMLMRQLGSRAPSLAADDVRTIDYLRAADTIVRPFGFEIVRLIGHGGMGAVFEGRDRKLDRPVAIKFILPERQDMFPLMRELLESEARALATVNHENAVQIHSIHHFKDNLFIVMELVRGLSIAHYVQQRGPMAEAQALRLTVQAARALATVHGGGIIHRDIKPENVFLTHNGQAKLGDFGLALASKGAPSSPAASSAAGTPAYMSPEVFEGEAPSVRSDVYALGMTLRYMLVGHRPDLGDTYEQMRRTIVHGQLPAIRGERTDVSAETELVLSTALKRSAAQRYKTAEAMAGACEKALLQLGARPERVETPPPRLALISSGRTLFFLLVMLLLGAAVGWFAHVAITSTSGAIRRSLDDLSRSIINTLVERPKYPLVAAETVAGMREGEPARVVGVVTVPRALDPDGRQYIVQDETGGVLIDDAEALGQVYQGLEAGEKVAVAGTIRVWNSLRVLQSAEYTERLGRTRLPRPIPLTLDQLGPAWGGWRVALRGVRLAEAPTSGAVRAIIRDEGGRTFAVRAEGDPSVLARMTRQPFDLVGVVLVSEVIAGQPGEVDEVFLLPLEVQPVAPEAVLAVPPPG